MINREKLYLSLIILFVTLFSCNNPFPDYTEKSDGIFMKLLIFEDEETLYKPNRYVSADVIIRNGEELIYRQYKQELLKPKHQLSFLFEHLNQGDSAAFKIECNQLLKHFPELKISNTEYVSAYIKVDKYLTINNNDDPEMLEQVILNKYLKENPPTREKKGVHTIEIKKGKGEKIKNGKNITIHYKGKYINQIEFDNTYNRSAFTFTYGTPGQVIKGLEIALKGMKEGEKSKIIIPSQLAFGDEGSSTQVIPPYTSVIYELEIVNVK